MGLDSVEFIMAIEKAFDLNISDADAERMTTPRKVVDHLASRLPTRSRDEIERTITQLMDDELGIVSFQWDESFVEDLGVD